VRGRRGYVASGAQTRSDVNTRARNTTSKPPLTHFICLPIGHRAELREKLNTFTTALLASEPPIAGLDPSIVIPARRLHLTLGVMSLADRSPSSSATPLGTAPQQSVERTLERAAALLQTLRPHVLAMLRGEDGSAEPLRLSLQQIDALQFERGRDPSDVRAHVLFAGPDLRSESAQRLKRVCDEIHRTFKDAGLLVDERRELKLHCTVLNTTYRKPRANGPRVPFSYSTVCSSAAVASLAAQNAAALQPSATPASAPRPPRRGEPNNASHRPVSVSLGTWNIDEIQICRMGSWGSQGEYVADARCSIRVS